MERVDKFKESLLFEEYKDTLLRSAKGLQNDIKKKYDYEVSSDLYKRIVNYQIKKYGGILRSRGSTRPSYGRIQNRKGRTYIAKWQYENYQQNKIIERQNKDGRRKKQKHL